MFFHGLSIYMGNQAVPNRGGMDAVEAEYSAFEDLSGVAVDAKIVRAEFRVFRVFQQMGGHGVVVHCLDKLLRKGKPQLAAQPSAGIAAQILVERHIDPSVLFGYLSDNVIVFIDVLIK